MGEVSRERSGVGWGLFFGAACVTCGLCHAAATPLRRRSGGGGRVEEWAAHTDCACGIHINLSSLLDTAGQIRSTMDKVPRGA